MLLADLVDASARVAATRSRKIKLAALAEALGRAGAGEVGPAAAFLAGQLRQGRVGVGWASITAVAVDPAPPPTPTATHLHPTPATPRETTRPNPSSASRPG